MEQRLHELVARYPVTRRALRPAALNAGIAALIMRRGQVPSSRVLRWLRYGWANQGYSGSVAYVHEVARAATVTPGSIVEVGSGLTSIVLSYVTRRDQPVVSLEHLPPWADRVARYTSRRGTHRVLERPLTRYDGYDWYALTADDLPADIGLVVVDGPPGGTRGGRFGALPQLAPRLRADAVLLLDDADRATEQQMLVQWEQDFGVRSEVHDHGSKAFAVIRLGARGSAIDEV